jgi:hypothetical protein
MVRSDVALVLQAGPVANWSRLFPLRIHLKVADDVKGPNATLNSTFAGHPVQPDEALRDRRYIPVAQIHVQDRGGYGPRFKQCEGFLNARGQAHDFAAGIFDRQRQIQGDEWLIFGD